MRTLTINIIPILIAGLIFYQQTAAQYKIPQSTFGAGGGQTTGSSFNVVGTIGQTAIGIVSSSANINRIGFWYQSGEYVTSIEQLSNTLPPAFRLEQNYPNPFNPTTTIHFAIPRQEHVVLKIFNALGREVAMVVNEKCEAGEYSIRFDANDLSSGVYLYRLHAGDFIQTKKFILLK